MEKLSVIKADGSLQEFDPQKLTASLTKAGSSQKHSEEVLNHITGLITGKTLKTSEIYREAFSYLREISHPVAIRYSMRKAIAELGPEGFAFEKFFAEILHTKGYTVVVDQKVLGKCVEHEIDVVAWNDKELILVESKFHNEYNFKTDLKIVLYVKERFDDLRESIFDYGGIKRKMTDGWLVTNTKFTENAIKYGSCNGMKMIGWNYPVGEDLQIMIERSKIIPITILSSISQSEIKTIINQGITTINQPDDILRNMKELLFNDQKIQAVKKEIEFLKTSI